MPHRSYGRVFGAKKGFYAMKICIENPFSDVCANPALQKSARPQHGASQ
jgi:hypothetical protein